MTTERIAMTTNRPVRKGKGPKTRPTEWTVGVTMLIAALIAWYNDRDTAALIAVASAVLPAIVTSITTWWEQRNANVVDVTPAVEN